VHQVGFYLHDYIEMNGQQNIKKLDLKYHIQYFYYTVQRQTAESADTGLVGTLSPSWSQRNNLKLPFYGTVQVGGQGCRKISGSREQLLECDYISDTSQFLIK